MTVMSRLAQRIQDAKVDLSADVDLPLSLINIYACSVYRFDGKHPVHTYVAAIHTAVAVAKLADWCEERHQFRPLRSTCKTPVRRLKMADLIENPAAYDSALHNAKAAGDRGCVIALRQLPRWISEQTGVAMPTIDGEFADKGLWAALTSPFREAAGHA